MNKKVVSIVLSFVLAFTMVIFPVNASYAASSTAENAIVLEENVVEKVKLTPVDDEDAFAVFSFTPSQTGRYQFEVLNPEFEYGMSNVELYMEIDLGNGKEYFEMNMEDGETESCVLITDMELKKGKTYTLSAYYWGEKSSYTMELKASPYDLEAQTIKSGSSAKTTFDVDKNHLEQVYLFTAPGNYRYEFEVTNPYISEEGYGGTFIEIYEEDGDIAGTAIAVEGMDCIAATMDKCIKGETYYVVVTCCADKTLTLKARKHSKHQWFDMYAEGNKNYVMCQQCLEDDEESFKVTLSKSSYTYNGKVQTPKVTVKGTMKKAKTTRTISSKNYTVTKSSGRKNVGKYNITVKFKNDLEGLNKIKRTYTIKPKTTSITQLTKAKKAFTVKWSKKTTQTSGYQICYGTSSNKDKGKKVLVASNKTISKKISGLKSGKKYYVWVRTYKTVKVDGKSTKIYSDWSKVKNITTK